MSQANYILICNGRGDVAIAKTPEDTAAAAMNCAANLVSFMELRYASHTLPPEVPGIVEQISHTQHAMMEMLQTGVKKAEAKQIVETMFQFLDQLEDALKE